MSRRVGWVTLGAAGGLLAWLQVLGQPLITPSAPLGLVSLQVATDVASARAIVASWAQQGVGIARTILLLEFALIALLVSGVWRVAAGRAGAAGRVAILAVWLSGAADLIENAALARTLAAGPTRIGVGATFVAAIVKLQALSIALIALVVAIRQERR